MTKKEYGHATTVTNTANYKYDPNNRLVSTYSAGGDIGTGRHGGSGALRRGDGEPGIPRSLGHLVP